VSVGFHIDELSSHQHAVARPPNGPLHQVTNLQLGPDLLQAFISLTVAQGRAARNHQQLCDLGQVGQNVLLHPIREKGILGTRAQILQRQHGDGLVELYPSTLLRAGEFGGSGARGEAIRRAQARGRGV